MARDLLDIDSKTIEELYDWYISENLLVNRRYQRKLVWGIDQGEIVNILLKIKNSFLPTKQILIGL